MRKMSLNVREDIRFLSVFVVIELAICGRLEVRQEMTHKRTFAEKPYGILECPVLGLEQRHDV